VYLMWDDYFRAKPKSTKSAPFSTFDTETEIQSTSTVDPFYGPQPKCSFTNFYQAACTLLG